MTYYFARALDAGFVSPVPYSLADLVGIAGLDFMVISAGLGTPCASTNTTPLLRHSDTRPSISCSTNCSNVFVP